MRAILLIALDIGMTNGDWVFMDVEMFKNNYWGDHTWRRGDGRDDDARKAYEALLRVTLLHPKSPRYDSFAVEVKMRAARDYGFIYGDEEVGILNQFNDVITKVS